MTPVESAVAKAWEAAGQDLGIDVIAPYLVREPDGSEWQAAAFVPSFGSPRGTLVAVLGEPSEALSRRSAVPALVSLVTESYCEYVRSLFTDTLNDWRFFGPADSAPSWFTGEPWGA